MDIGASDKVVLLHGLMRRAGSMRTLTRRLEAAGFDALSVGYPSRKHSIEDLAGLIAGKIGAISLAPDQKLHLVTHSLGGIIARLMFDRGLWPNPGRLVMIAPPNGGSELADILEKAPFLWRIYGKPVRELGTGPQSLPNRLPPSGTEVGVIAGDKSLNPLFSLLINGPGDGKVSVEKTKFSGMTDFAVVHRSHSFIMNAPETARHAIHFLRHGAFEKIP